MKKDTTANNEELNGSTFNSGKSKGLEALEENLEMVTFNNNEDFSNYLVNYYIIEKELKALEIIIKSGYISLDKMLSQNYITRKEYDLLKEIPK